MINYAQIRYITILLEEKEKKWRWTRKKAKQDCFNDLEGGEGKKGKNFPPTPYLSRLEVDQ